MPGKKLYCLFPSGELTEQEMLRVPDLFGIAMKVLVGFRVATSSLINSSLALLLLILWYHIHITFIEIVFSVGLCQPRQRDNY